MTITNAAGAASEPPPLARGDERAGIFATLIAEQAELARLMAELADLDDPSAERRRVLFTKVAFRLALHADSEDAILYSAIASYPETMHAVQVARREQAQLESLVEALRAHPIEDTAWLDGFLRLQDAVQQHIQTEQRELFPRAWALLSDETASELDERYRARHDAGKTHL